MTSKGALWAWAAVAGLLISAAGPGETYAQLSKACRSAGGDRMVCTENHPAANGGRRDVPAEAHEKSDADRDAEKAPLPPWHGAVAKAVLDGRCADAKRIALQNGDLQAAKLAVDLCVAR